MYGAAGRLVLDGHAAAAYDWTLHREVEVNAVGHEFEGYYGWHYPPTFLFVAAALASLPYRVLLASEDSQIGVRMRVCLYGQDRTHPGSS
jgi:hypothetical protein